MFRALVITTRFHDGRYHGADDWPPAPARLFQALVCAAAGGATLSQDDKDALIWLEELWGRSPPTIAAPPVCDGRRFATFVPNNDLDFAVGNPKRLRKIREGKVIRPRLFDRELPFLYAWSFDGNANDERHARTIASIAEGLYQFGRGVDMAWASAEIMDAGEAIAKLAAYPGPTHRPNKGGRGATLLCPQPGSLASLIERFDKNRKRFKTIYLPAPTKKGAGEMKPAGQVFTQAPKPRFRPVPYDSPMERRLFDLRGGDAQAEFAAWPMTGVVRLVECVRDAACVRLQTALPGKEAVAERVFVGRDATEADKIARIRILPLPSIGHAHVDRAIRRVAIEVPPNCPLSAGDVFWAFSGLDLGVDYRTGEILHENQTVLTPAEDETMLAHYGFGGRGRNGFLRWRTVTPAALPERAARRRIDPSRLRDRETQKDGRERLREESRAATAVLQALRHVGVADKAQAIRVQREPFEGAGARAESFASGTRFAKERLWHVEMTFAAPQEGPLVIGDGRYLGLGIMARVKDRPRGILTFAICGKRPPAKYRWDVAEAVRRALMSRSADDRGRVPDLFSGHESDGAAARSGHHRHVYLLADDADGDGFLDRIIVVAPWRVDRSWKPRGEDRAQFESVVSGLEFVRAGSAGVLSLGFAQEPEARDPLFAQADTWKSYTPYQPTRHPKRGVDAAGIVVQDLLGECSRRQLPRPRIEIVRLDVGPRGGICAEAKLQFEKVVTGPIILGRSAHQGGGVFVAVS